MDPINGKEYFFTEESFLRVTGPNSFVDWLQVCLAEQGYKSDIVTDQQTQKEDICKIPGKGYENKKGLPHLPDRSMFKQKSLQKVSSLTHTEQKRYLELFQKYILTFLQQQPTLDEIKELTELESLQVKVSAEQTEFLKCLESIANTSKDQYNMLQPNAKRYVEEKLHHQHSLVKEYPKNYSTAGTIPLKMNTGSGQLFNLIFQKTVLQMGPDPKVFLPDMTAVTKPCMSMSYEKIVRRYPPLHAKKDDGVWNREPCSSDMNAHILASEYSCDIVLSANVLKCLVDNHAPNFDRDWQIPIVIKQDGVSDSLKKTVYLDKPFCAKVLSNRDKNTLYHKYVLKAYITHPAPNKKVKTSRGKSQGASDDVTTGPVSSAHSTFSRINSRPRCQEADNLFETETSIDDLETFGSFEKMPKRKRETFEAEILNTNISKLPSSGSASSVNHSEPNLPRHNSTMDTKEKSMDTKEKSMDTNKKSMDTNERSLDINNRVMHTNERSMDTNERSMDTNKRVMHTNERSMYTNEILLDTNKKLTADSMCLTDPSDEITVKKCKEKYKVEKVKSDTDSDDENMLLIDCDSSDEKDHQTKLSVSSGTADSVKPADISSAKLIDVNDAGLSKHNVEEYQDSPMSPDNCSDNVSSVQRRDSSCEVSLTTDRTYFSEAPASPEARETATLTGSLQQKQSEITKHALLDTGSLLHCSQDSPMSPENNSKHPSRSETKCIPCDSQLDSPMSPDNSDMNSLHRNEIQCNPSHSFSVRSEFDSPMSPDNKGKYSLRTKVPVIPNDSVGGHSLDSPISPDRTITNTIKTRSCLHPKSHDSESDSHDDSLVVDIPSESENPQEFLSPRALRARKRSSCDNLPLSLTLSALDKPVQVCDQTELTEDKLIAVDTECVGVCLSDEIKQVNVDGGPVDIKRKRGRQRTDKPEEMSNKFKAAVNRDLPRNSIMKDEDPGSTELTKPVSTESRKGSSSKKTGSTTLESILQLQDKMLPPSAQHNQLMKGDNIKKYKQPEDKKISYNLWELNGLKVLTRSSSHGILREFPNKVYPVSIVPKLEYQSNFGVEQTTQSEMSRNWITCLIKLNSHLIRGRIDAHTSQIIMLEDLDISKVLQPSIQFVPQEFFCFLHGLFSHLIRMPAGNYLLNHSKGDNYITVLKSIDTNRRGSYDLHFDHKVFVSTDTPSTTVPWIPIDPTVIMPFHKKLGRVPATFEPKDFMRSSRKHRRKPKQKKSE